MVMDALNRSRGFNELDLDYVKKNQHNATYVNGVMRWISNGSVVPKEIALAAKSLGLAVDIETCNLARETELNAFLAEYRKRDHTPTREQMVEMRAAFGPGAKVVNVLTGKVTKL
jgi:hypothetical protein